MVNPPTNSAMNANTSSAVFKNPNAWPMELVASSITV